MLPYNLKLALGSIRRNPLLSALMVAAIGVGVGACMTTLTIYYMAAKNPIPQRSDVLYHVQLDNRPIGTDYEPGEEPRDQLSWTEATNLLRDGRGERRAAMFKTGFIVQPDTPEVRPFRAIARATGNDFFPMFDVPFLYGGPWDDQSDASPGFVTVLSRATNEQVFGGENSVGRTIRLGDNDFRVAGVLDDWDVAPKFYDLTNGPWQEVEEVYVPFSLTETLELDTWGNTQCSGGGPINSFQEFLASECNWITYWVELPDAAAVADYRSYLAGYIAQQKAMGRFERPPTYRLRDVEQWLIAEEVADDSTKVMVWLSVLFLVVCLLNTVGLILAKFMGRAPQIALRRALGASRWALFRQHLVEVLTVGSVGGLLGLLLAMLGLVGVRALMDTDATERFSMDWTMAATAIGVALLASAVAGIYPAMRIGRIAPASYLKTQ